VFHEFMPKTMFKIKLQDFEGPFDLLLYFIKRDELDIYNIPIAKITQEFLDYIHIMQSLDIEIASEFILMAATLLQIKAEMLLRQNEETEEEIPIEDDPRTPLVEQLIEYKKFKEASKFLARQAEEFQNHLYRKVFDADFKLNENEVSYKNASLFSLINALNNIVKRRSSEISRFHQVNLFPVSIDDKKKEIMNLIRRKSRFNFTNFIQYFSRIEIIVSFLAILELARANQIVLVQQNFDEDIIVMSNLNLN